MNTPDPNSAMSRFLLRIVPLSTCSWEDAYRIALDETDSKVQASQLLFKAQDRGFIGRPFVVLPAGVEAHSRVLAARGEAL